MPGSGCELLVDKRRSLVDNGPDSTTITRSACGQCVESLRRSAIRRGTFGADDSSAVHVGHRGYSRNSNECSGEYIDKKMMSGYQDDEHLSLIHI